ncbi:MAG: cytochrome b/b6 domain-containing protein [Nitrospirota bacterium]
MSETTNKSVQTGILIRRFSQYRIVEHWLQAGVFILLVITGISQKFHTYDLSQWLVFHLGGIDAVRLMHRAAGLILIILIIQHLVVAAVGLIRLRWQASMIIQMKDFQDAVTNLKYYFGIKNHPAQCDRYDYKQKFDYWGVLVSNLIMIVSGLILWFPITTSRYLYGEFIPAANVIHTNQSLLVILIIAIWHIYNSIFSPEIFPFDTSILTGYLSKERMVREHPLELARMERAAGKKQHTPPHA